MGRPRSHLASLTFFFVSQLNLGPSPSSIEGRCWPELQLVPSLCHIYPGPVQVLAVSRMQLISTGLPFLRRIPGKLGLSIDTSMPGLDEYIVRT
ncbi:hypothetical protein N7495_002138 [Penicillium taxi]|uniref:uncharacterized protein n=1 Tax=Penicillium taxi TaxID=168475 RepID=UPI0025459924|nr:uncharacterized protein N7495_002138 [Penicillium taxi]KAJ5901610.1 hypothetical protein N7495_002138 [Penicillium taxi]